MPIIIAIANGYGYISDLGGRFRAGMYTLHGHVHREGVGPMARVNLVISDDDRFIDQARREGMTMSAWLTAAARERLEKAHRARSFDSPEDVEEFFRAGDTAAGPGPEPDWKDHLEVIDRSRRHGLPGT